MKLFKKSKNLEVKAKKKEKKQKKEEKEENGESSKKVQTKDRKPHKNRFVACLRAAWRRIAGWVRRRHTSPAREEEVPEPSNVHTADCSVNICNISDIEEAECYVVEIQANVSSAEREEDNVEEIQNNVSSEEREEDNVEEIQNNVSSEEREEDNVEEIQNNVSSEEREEDVEEIQKNVSSEERKEVNVREIDIVLHKVNISDEEEEKSWPDSLDDEEEEEDEEMSWPDSWYDDDLEDKKAEIIVSPEVNISHEEEEKSWPDSWEDEEEEVEEKKSWPDSWEDDVDDEEASEQDNNSCAARAPGPSRIKKDDDSEGLASVPLSKECFTFHKVLGEGYFGRVFMATDKIRQQSVAIKQMGKARILRHGHFFEERHVLQISHRCPHLIHGLGSFQTADNIYFVMELATGGDLREFLDKNYPLDLPVIQFIAAEVTCGVQFLHKNGIIHRDLKPENILVAANGHLKITDFGLSATGVTGTIENWCAGTPGYIAPEVMEYRPHGPWSDFFAIGVIVYELVTIMHPFPGNDMQEYRYFLQFKPYYPSFMAYDTVNFIDSLLCNAPSRRLGVLDDIRGHFFFKSINWEEMEAGRAEPPAILQSFSANRRPAVSIPAVDRIKDEDQAIFLRFGFVSPVWSQQYHPVIFCKEPPK